MAQVMPVEVGHPSNELLGYDGGPGTGGETSCGEWGEGL